LNGSEQYSKKLRGQTPAQPAFDTARNRIIVSDGDNLLAYGAAEFKRRWSTRAKGAVNNNQPWYIRVLSGGRIAVCRYVRENNRYGYGSVVYDGETGKRKWQYVVNKYRRDNKRRLYERTNTIGPTIFGKTKAFVPVQFYKRERKGRKYIQERTLALHVLDRKTGKKLREFKIESKGKSARHYVYPLSVRPTAGHAVLLYRQRVGNAYKPGFTVVSARTGKAVITKRFGSNLGSGHVQNMMIQRLRPLVTAGGCLLVPTGDGIQCYASTGPAVTPGQDNPEEKADEKKD
jgi:hypothetical protein